MWVDLRAIEVYMMLVFGAGKVVLKEFEWCLIVFVSRMLII